MVSLRNTLCMIISTFIIYHVRTNTASIERKTDFRCDERTYSALPLNSSKDEYSQIDVTCDAWRGLCLFVRCTWINVLSFLFLLSNIIDFVVFSITTIYIYIFKTPLDKYSVRTTYDVRIIDSMRLTCSKLYCYKFSLVRRTIAHDKWPR